MSHVQVPRKYQFLTLPNGASFSAGAEPLMVREYIASGPGVVTIVSPAVNAKYNDITVKNNSADRSALTVNGSIDGGASVEIEWPRAMQFAWNGSQYVVVSN